ncbi:IclR family transcriptional regulator [Cognatishimia activa]|uniref:Pectin degradation repressor protein KdgR n=1 Tax=Cognatishimia activa TaxID=1715691 RepID=A0A0P1IWL4_9RHOB|nr:IclR family transcriptional regulator [Cognatishimia activa]MEE2945856.1 IclR family transcriptional regulator [Pseudomonadota bacterium]CUI88759.1 Pectin degradation repressor protein KdgR [Cognatishimia activa]CUK25650.1 Pectin degradation repressor protein KdgR [Cognatishimia activa]
MSAKTSTTVLKAFSVLEALGDSDTPMSATQIARETGYDRATCYRLLMTLKEAQYVSLDVDTKKFEISFRVVSLARKLLQEDKEVEMVREVMRMISHRSTETCHYSTLDGEKSVITLRERGKQVVSVEFGVGESAELYSTAGGKAMLAFADTRFTQKILSKKLPRHTVNTICTPSELRQELLTVRAHGVAYDNEELMIGLRCLAAPIFEADGSVRSTIAMSGPTGRYTDERVAELEVILREGARELTRRRGGPQWSV